MTTRPVPPRGGPRFRTRPPYARSGHCGAPALFAPGHPRLDVFGRMGPAAGLVLALLLSRYVESLLYGVTATDPMTFVGVALGFAGVALVATWLPSRRAARIDPLLALRAE